MTRAEFWTEAKRRRNQVLFWIAGWLVAGAVFMGVLETVLPDDKRHLAPIVSLVVWFVVFMYLRERIVSMRCFRCGERAFQQLWFPLSVSKCKRCGVSDGT